MVRVSRTGVMSALCTSMLAACLVALAAHATVGAENGSRDPAGLTRGEAAAAGGRSVTVTGASPLLARVKYSLGTFRDQTLTQLQADLDHLQQVGANGIWIVAPFEWLYDGTSATPNATNAAKFDNVINESARRGLPLIVQIHGTPAWISSAGAWHGPTSALSRNGKTERQNWVDCLRNFLGRSTPAGNQYGSVVTYAEIWNEPDSASFWAPSVNVGNYARLVHDSTQVARQVAPNVMIAAPNTGRNATGFLGLFYDAMNSAYGASTARANHYWFDLLGVHPYAGDASSGFDPATDPSAAKCQHSTTQGTSNWCFLGYRLMYSLVVQREGVAKDLIFGEFGYKVGTGYFAVTEATRQRYLTSAYQLARNDGYVRQFNWYHHNGSDGFTIHNTGTEAAFTAVATGP
jgi:hypothetical protein